MRVNVLIKDFRPKNCVGVKFLDADAEAPVAGHAPVHGIQP